MQNWHNETKDQFSGFLRHAAGKLIGTILRLSGPALGSDENEDIRQYKRHSHFCCSE